LHQSALAARRPGRIAYATRRWRSAGVPYTFIAPFYLLFVVFTVGPLIYAAYLSLFNHTLTGSNLFAGLQNYRTLFGTPDFWSGLAGVVVLGIIQVPVMLAISVFLAVVLDMGLVRYGAVFRLLYFVPFAIPGVVAAIMWGYLLVPDLSPLDVITAHIGLGTPNFLGGGFLWPVLGNILIWELLGYNMLIIYTALQAVPRELTEAAVLDGAGAWTIARSIRIPMVRGAILLAALFSVIGTLQLFTEPELLMNLTGAISSHLTPNLYLYTQAFSGQEANLAAAGALVLAVLIAVAAGAISLALRRSTAQRGARHGH
jgi:multiple sugar transport system permease protein